MKRNWLGIAVFVALLVGIGSAATATLPAFAMTPWRNWTNSLVQSGVLAQAVNYPTGGPQRDPFVTDSIRLPRAGVAALSCTLSLSLAEAYPFIFTSASTTTLTMNTYTSSGAACAMLFGDSVAFGEPCVASRYIFTTVAADTPCGVFVRGIPLGALTSLFAKSKQP